MTTKLIGPDTLGDQANLPIGYAWATQAVCTVSGELTEIPAYCFANSNVRIALYSDDGADGLGNLIAESASTPITAGGWRSVAVAGGSVTSGKKYWLAVQVETTGGVGFAFEANYFEYVLQEYGAFPADGTSWTPSYGWTLSLQGWGVLVLTPSGISQPVAIGEPEVQQQSAAQTITPSGIAQAVAIGTPILTYPQDIAPSGIAQVVALGTPQLTLAVKPSGIAQQITIGSPIITQPQLYESYAEESAYQNVYNNYWLCQTFTPASTHKITSLKLKLCRVGSPGSGTVSIKATDVDGKPTGGDLCSASIDGNSLPESPEKLGFSLGAGTNLQASTKYAIMFRFPSGNSSNYGRTRRMYPGAYAGGAAVTSNDSGSTWEVVTDWDFVFEDWGEPLMQTLYPEGIAQPVVYGSPIVYFVGTVYPSGIAQQVAFGVPRIEGGIVSGIIWTEGIVQPVAVGKPTLYKYVWHVVLDGEYRTESPEKNRMFVIGRDDYGNPVWGEAHDTDESALVGERLDFQQELAIPTTAQAAATAEAILSKMRLNKARGVILIPPNCGQELFDTVQLSDAGANQSAVKFRVVGIRFEYNPKQARYEHRLVLGAP